MIDIKISYFYHVRNLSQNMVPISTAVWDPKWYHAFTGNYSYQFKDKRGIWNGIRAEILNPSKVKCDCATCDHQSQDHCTFLPAYKEYLHTLDFCSLIHRFEKLNQQIKSYEHTNDDYTFVLLVYETPSNPCSERVPLQEWFAENDYPLLELTFDKKQKL